MTEQELLDKGYRRYKGGAIHKNSDCYYAKSISDAIGKKYQIVFYFYDWSKYQHFNGPNPNSWMPEIYFCLAEDDDFGINLFHTFAGFKDSIEYVEEYAEKTWKNMEFGYIERF